MAESTWPWCLTGDSMQEKINNAKTLMVGAGGIGCELLKTLVLTGFKNIHVIDLDTIETSNLNRQFLFRKRHVGHSKAEIAAEAAKQLRTDLDITAYQANIKETRFDVNFFRQFQMVLNGLDNLDARRHVNRLCLAAGVPLVESGTAGYLGQVSVHIGGEVECFECQPKPTAKTFPICTIRNTPEKPIHCIVWAKELLFPRLFGAPEVATDLEAATEKNNADDQEQEVDADGVPVEDTSFYQRTSDEDASTYATRIFQRVFGTDIDKLRSVEELWKMRRPPSPLSLDQLQLPDTVSTAAGNTACKALGINDAHSAWSVPQCAAVFIESIKQFLEQRPDEVGSAVFDKDDDLAMEVVAAAANLRAACFGIPLQSLFDIKGMAGNIIHAIATTNAVISGLITTEALKLLASCSTACKTTYLRQDVSNRRLLTPANCEPPNPKCMVCGKATAYLSIDTNTTTLKEFLDKVARKRLSLVEPTVTCDAFFYEEGEDLEEDEVAQNAKFLPVKLVDLPGTGIVNGSVLDISDQSQAFNLQIIVSHKDNWDESENPEKYELTGTVPVAQKDEEMPENGNTHGDEGHNKAAPVVVAPIVRELSGGVLELLEDDEDDKQVLTSKKRKLEDGVEEDDVGRAVKKAKDTASDGEDIIEILD